MKLNKGHMAISFDEYIENYIRDYNKQIFSYCYRMLNNRHEAEDAVQEVFLKIFIYICHKKQVVDSPKIWLYKVAHNYCINII